ncbi:hypothetical protein JL721_757 [Aureococcus anophagefferens]|nr:hypothetical protein JL721_757 [Aureococcus anophagefferens]
MYGLRVGADMYESNKLTGAIDELYVYTSALDREAISVLWTVVTIYGNTSYIDWDDWHHYCLTYDGSDVVLYFDGLAEATARRLDTETMYGLRVGADMYESNKLTGAIDELYVYTSALDREAISVLYGSTVVTIYGNTSYIDWDDWHHYCLTYDGSDVVLYFDGLAEATAPASLDTETMYGLRVGADMYESNKLTGAIDELYVYTSALDREAISVLWVGDGVPDDATGAYSGDTYKNGHAEPRPDGEPRRRAGFDGEVYAVLPDALTYEALTGDEERTICLWARIDDWDGGFLRVRSDSADGASLGLAVGDAESNVTLALSGTYQTVVTIYGNTSYIDWDDWHHYCLTYDGSDVVLYFDGLAEATAPASLDTETMYGLRVGADMYESNKLTGAIDELYVYTSALDREAISVLWTVVTIYGNTSYIDWDDWHHYCLTYDGSDVVLYFDGLAEATAPASLDTETMYGLRVGADMYESNKLTGAIDELYVYTSALDREAISVLYGSVTADDATGAYSGDTYKNGHARNLGPTESRDGGTRFGDGEVYAVLPDALTYEALTGDEERTICLWARIDDWDGGFLRVRSDSADGASLGLAVGDAESNVTLALSGSYQTVVTIYGNTSYIDWDDWHHYCLTYDGSDVVLY